MKDVRMLPYLIVIMGFGLIVLSTEVPDETDMKSFDLNQERAVISVQQVQGNKKAHQKEKKAPCGNSPSKRLEKLLTAAGKSDINELLVTLVEMHSEILKLLSNAYNSKKTTKHTNPKRRDKHKSAKIPVTNSRRNKSEWKKPESNKLELVPRQDFAMKLRYTMTKKIAKSRPYAGIN